MNMSEVFGGRALMIAVGIAVLVSLMRRGICGGTDGAPMIDYGRFHLVQQPGQNYIP